ncbi:ABC exporter membrane fusion protein [Pseudanabaena sp. PCC 6802]|uniref:ABC exporter membrane fusion protein n=1 Tax=Pseudanabaena sp. PCC 6802 TaxID=118173 RepID=UPI00034A3586|nr:ABC exporter membrane fusion protein [Pseudanabaena sp. PCC 6802]
MDIPSKTRQAKSSKRWIAIAIATGLVTLAVAVYTISRYRPLSPSPILTAETTTANAGIVTALGRLEPRGEAVHLSSTSSLEGTRILQVLVKEGDAVRAGQMLAILDSRDRALAILKEAQGQLSVTQARLAQVKAGAKAGEIDAQTATIQRMEAELQGNVTAQVATVERLAAELRNAETEYERYQKLSQEGVISASILDSKRLTFESAQAKLQEGRATLKRIRGSVQAQLNEAKANLNRIAEVRPTDVQVAEADVDRAIATVEKTKADLDLAYVRAPKAGRVLKVHIRPGEAISDRGKGVFEIGQTDQIDVVAEVYETDIGKVQVGQSATITSPAFGGKLRGTVAQIGWEVGKKDILNTDPAAATDVRVVEVKIQLNSSSSKQVAGLSNLQVTVEIALGAVKP